MQNLTLCWTKEESRFKCGIDGDFKYTIVTRESGDEFIITACHCDDGVTFNKVDCQLLNF
jgi:hypothetical protein